MAKKKIAQCKGFDNDLCRKCKRQSDIAFRILTDKLMKKRSTGETVCEHYIR